jgi:hypothetical protein
MAAMTIQFLETLRFERVAHYFAGTAVARQCRHRITIQNESPFYMKSQSGKPRLTDEQLTLLLKHLPGLRCDRQRLINFAFLYIIILHAEKRFDRVQNRLQGL